MSPSKASLIEGFADITLLFGLFPNNISVIGVGWFLGLIFVFYLIFPFYCILLKSRKRAWIAFAVSLALNYVCESYFNVGRSNIIYCMCYLIAGGLVYLYRAELENFRCKYWWSVMALLILGVVLYFAVGASTFTLMVVSVTMLVWALGNRGVLQNRFTKFFSSISMEVYLSHMVMFRVIEKLGLNRILGNGGFQYIITVMMTLVGTVVFSVIVKRILELLETKLSAIGH